MKRSGTATLPLHTGKAPAWLFNRMVKLAAAILEILRLDFSEDEILLRLSHPHWFQAFGCVLGFDWHSSGITTTVCGAIKEALKDRQHAIGIYVAGGKGKAALKTPQEIEQIASRTGIDAERLVNASRLSAKVDNSALQDGYRLYHHTIFFTKNHNWCVIQQGLNETNRLARRYHWVSHLTSSFVNEPHAAICAQAKSAYVLDLTAKESAKTRDACVEITTFAPDKTVDELKRIVELELPRRHYITAADINIARLKKQIVAIHEAHPQSFEQLLLTKGAGEKTLRALSLISELIYCAPPSIKDPARFSFAHGGKDGHPFPVDKETYDKSIEILRKAVSKARIGHYEKLRALKRLSLF